MPSEAFEDYDSTEPMLNESDFKMVKIIQTTLLVFTSTFNCELP